MLNRSQYRLLLRVSLMVIGVLCDRLSVEKNAYDPLHGQDDAPPVGWNGTLS